MKLEQITTYKQLEQHFRESLGVPKEMLDQWIEEAIMNGDLQWLNITS